MAMILDAFMSKFSTLLADFVYEEVIKVLGVKEELQELRRRMRSIQCLLKDAEKKKFGESSTELWLSELKDVMYDAEDIIDLCRTEGAQLLADHNSESRTSSFSVDSSNPSEEQELAVEELFDKIIPPQSLEDFTISGFFGRRFPNWMVSSPFEICVPNLTKLVFNGINSCAQLPSLGQLPELKDLRMYYVTKVKKIGPEFFGGDINLTGFAFPHLEKLQISNFPELAEWSFGLQVEQNAYPKLKVLPCLQKLTISYCPMLKRLPKGLKYSTVKFLEIDGARSLKLDDNLPAEIEELSLSDCKNLEKICCAPTLKKLYVNERYVEEWEALSCVEKLDSLQELSFTNFAIKSLPEWLLKLLQQRGLQNDSNDDFHLHLRCSKEVVQGCLKGGIYWDLIQHIPQVYVYGDGHHFRYKKEPYVYKHISN